jgi:hypothetical protein
MTDGPKVRERLHETIQATVSIDNDLPDGAVLMGWVTIAEWMAPDGKRWLSIIDGAADPSEGLAAWQRQGYLHNALFDPDGFIPDEDENA